MHRNLRVALIIVTTLATVAFVSLGFWQLRRLAERKRTNALVTARLRLAPVPIESLPRDSALMHYRRLLVRGRYDYAHEVVTTGRTRDGSPGVNIITPVRIAGHDTAILVNRGWVYSPDGLTVDLTQWREPDTLAGTGYVRPLDRPYGGKARLSDKLNAYRWLDASALRASIPYPIYPLVVVLEGDSVNHAGVPPRIAAPPLDEGPHLSYAIQWFSFAVIAVVGTVLFLMRLGRDERDAIEGLIGKG